jgi:[ribosomal protein S5]-alanine N-acetyltransferase
MNESTYTVPTLTTDSLTLRSLTENDNEAVYALRSNDIVNKHIDRKKCESMEEAMSFIRKIIDNKTMYWAVTKNPSPSLIGTVAVWNITNESAEMGYELLPEYWSKGIMKEAITTVVQYVFSELEIKQINAFVHADNINSIHLLKKLNFVFSSFEPENMHKYILTKGN